jgi:hypothetical protein
LTITNETKRESYESIQPLLGQRQLEVYTVLRSYGPFGATANELATLMAVFGYFPKPERNFVHPRLNELVEMGRVEVAGKRKCNVSGRTCAVYRAV